MPFLESASWQLLKDVHNRATVNLAPTTATRDQLIQHGIENVHLWRRGVDTSLFSRSLRDQSLRSQLAEPGERFVRYVGHRAGDKQVRGPSYSTLLASGAASC